MQKLETTLRKSGTTILAMRYRGGVLMAGDKRMTDMHYHEDDYLKIHSTGNKAFIGCAGVVACIQRLIEVLIYNCEILEKKVETPIYVDGQSQLLKTILQGQFAEMGPWMYALDYIGIPILCGFDPNRNKGRIFSYDEAGGIYERDDYATMGSGSILARTVLDSDWDCRLSEEEACRLAILCMMRASRDNFTAPPTMAPVTIRTASAKKTGSVDDADALAIAKKIYQNDLRRKGLR